MPGTLGSRNTAINNVPSSGVQQSGNSLAGGRFASNNIPVALSQVCVLFLFLFACGLPKQWKIYRLNPFKMVLPLFLFKMVLPLGM